MTSKKPAGKVAVIAGGIAEYFTEEGGRVFYYRPASIRTG
jgi:hypothetical protein